MLTYEEINKEWAKDIGEYEDGIDLISSNKSIPRLHHKYYMMYVHYNIKHHNMNDELKVLERQKYEYYNGTMDVAEIKSLGWSLQPLKILKADISRYIDSDKDIIKAYTRIAYCAQIVKYLEEILKKINSRQYEIKNHIELVKLQQGVV